MIKEIKDAYEISSKISQGDTVTGPNNQIMTLQDINEGVATCVWFEGSTLMEANLPLSSLQKVVPLYD